MKLFLYKIMVDVCKNNSAFGEETLCNDIIMIISSSDFWLDHCEVKYILHILSRAPKLEPEKPKVIWKLKMET